MFCPRFLARGLAVSIAAFAAASALALQPALGQDATFGASETVDSAELAEHRAGSFTVSGDGNETLVAESQQTVTGTSSGNSIGGSANSGDINVGDQAMSNARGMVNTTANTGANALVQGVMSLTLVFTDSAP